MGADEKLSFLRAHLFTGQCGDDITKGREALVDGLCLLQLVASAATLLYPATHGTPHE